MLTVISNKGFARAHHRFSVCRIFMTDSAEDSLTSAMFASTLCDNAKRTNRMSGIGTGEQTKSSYRGTNEHRS